MATNAGLQPDGIHVMLNPDQIFNIQTAVMVNPDVCPYVWLTDVSVGGPKEELSRHVATPPAIQPLTDFLTTAAAIFDNNFGPAILAWSSMYSMTVYKQLLTEVRHFNLPVLYGLPTVGKTLIAQCGAWLNGCSDLHIASRCTLAFVTTWLTSSTLPFVWDDPASSEEVAQLAVDLANGAVRGKTGEDVRTPLTGCLVTANFDLSVLYKFFSRLVVFPVSTLNRQKETGDARLVEDKAHKAAAALPLVMSALNTIQITDIATEVTRLQLEADIRVVEGIAVPLLISRIILNLCGCYHFMPTVMQYIQEKMLPYYREALETVIESQELPIVNGGDAFIRKILAVVQHNGTNGSCAIVKDMVAIRKDKLQFIPAKILRREVVERGGKTNHAVRLQGRPTKCISLPSDSFGDLWEVVKAALGEGEPAAPEPDHQAAPEPEPDHHQAAPQPEPDHHQAAPEPEPDHHQAAPEPEPVHHHQAAPEPEPDHHQAAPEPEPDHHQAAPEPEPDHHQAAPEPEPDHHQAAPEPEPDHHQAAPEPEPVHHQAAPEPEPDHQQVANQPPANLPQLLNLVPANLRLPFPTRKKADKEQVPCHICGKVGQSALLWICCNECDHWFHRKCSRLTPAAFKKLKDNPTSPWACTTCKKD